MRLAEAKTGKTNSKNKTTKTYDEKGKKKGPNEEYFRFCPKSNSAQSILREIPYKIQEICGKNRTKPNLAELIKFNSNLKSENGFSKMLKTDSRKIHGKREFSKRFQKPAKWGYFQMCFRLKWMKMWIFMRKTTSAKNENPGTTRRN